MCSDQNSIGSLWNQPHSHHEAQEEEEEEEEESRKLKQGQEEPTMATP